MKIRISAIVVISALAACARPAAAQRGMYGMGEPGAGESRSQFVSEARARVGALLADYESAWGSRDAAGVSRVYADNAVLYPAGGGMLTGRDAIRGYMVKTLPTVAPVSTRMMEFRASGDLAYATVQVTYETTEGGAAHRYVGTDALLLHHEWTGEWIIVSQLSRPEAAAAAGADAPKPAG